MTNKNYFFLIGFFVIFLLFLVSPVSAKVCSVPGVYNQTDYCDVGKQTKPLLEDYYSCVNDYECVGGSCIFADRAGCLGTVGIDCSSETSETCDDQLGCRYDIYASSCLKQDCSEEWNYDQIGCMEVPGCNWNIDIPSIDACVGESSCSGTVSTDCASLSNTECMAAVECVPKGVSSCIKDTCDTWDDSEGTCNSVGGCSYSVCGDQSNKTNCESASCTWQGDAGYCEAKFKEVKEQTGFLQTMLDRIVTYFTNIYSGIFSGDDEAGAGFGGSGAVISAPYNLQTSRPDDSPIVTLSWNRTAPNISLTTNQTNYLKVFEDNPKLAEYQSICSGIARNNGEICVIFDTNSSNSSKFSIFPGKKECVYVDNNLIVCDEYKSLDSCGDEDLMDFCNEELTPLKFQGVTAAEAKDCAGPGGRPTFGSCTLNPDTDIDCNGATGNDELCVAFTQVGTDHEGDNDCYYYNNKLWCDADQFANNDQSSAYARCTGGTADRFCRFIGLGDAVEHACTGDKSHVSLLIGRLKASANNLNMDITNKPSLEWVKCQRNIEEEGEPLITVTFTGKGSRDSVDMDDKIYESEDVSAGTRIAYARYCWNSRNWKSHRNWKTVYFVDSWHYTSNYCTNVLGYKEGYEEGSAAVISKKIHNILKWPTEKDDLNWQKLDPSGQNRKCQNIEDERVTDYFSSKTKNVISEFDCVKYAPWKLNSEPSCESHDSSKQACVIFGRYPQTWTTLLEGVGTEPSFISFFGVQLPVSIDKRDTKANCFKDDGKVKCDLSLCETQTGKKFESPISGVKCTSDMADAFCEEIGYADSESHTCTDYHVGASTLTQSASNFGSSGCAKEVDSNWLQTVICNKRVEVIQENSPGEEHKEYNIYRSPASSLAFIKAGMPIEDSTYQKIGIINSTSAGCSLTEDSVCETVDNLTGLDFGNYYYLVQANGSVLDPGSSPATFTDGISSYSLEEHVLYMVDTQPPAIIIDSPSEGGNFEYQYDSEDFELQKVLYAISDNFFVSACGYYLRGGSLSHNQTISCSQGEASLPYSQFEQGISYTLNIWATDVYGNTAAEEITFTVTEYKDRDAPEVDFMDPTQDSLSYGSSYAQTYIDAFVKVSDDHSLQSLEVTLYNREGDILDSFLGSIPANTRDHTEGQRFENLPYGLYFLKATVNDSAGNVSVSEEIMVALSQTEKLVSLPFVEIVNLPSDILSYVFSPTDFISFGVNVSDDEPGLNWELSTDTGSAESIVGVLSGTGPVVIPFNNFRIPMCSDSNECQQEISFVATDSIGWIYGDSFTISVKNENCEDGIDNDGDGILDDLDKDCNDMEIAVGDMLAVKKVLTHRTLDVNCIYATQSTDLDQIAKCVKLNVSGINCPISEIEESASLAKFRNCDTGGREQVDADLSCYVNPECFSVMNNVFTKKINITKFSICKDGESEANPFILDLAKPEKDDAYDIGEDELEFKLEVTNNYDGVTSMDVVVEVQLYDISEEEVKTNVTSSPISISYPIEKSFELTMPVPLRSVEDNQNRLYYKAYMLGEEDDLCVSGSIPIILQGEGCIDEDGDNYCSVNDCEDNNTEINSGAVEICMDELDNDCDLLIDDEDTEDCVVLPAEATEIPAGEADDLGGLDTRGERRIMETTSRIDFEIGEESHIALVGTITATTVTITISSDPLDLTLEIGQTKDVDADGDGIEDLRVTLNGIINGKADITFRSIYVAPPSESRTPSAPRTPVTPTKPAEPKEGSNTFLIVIIVLVVIVAIVVLLVFLKKRRKGQIPMGGPGGPGPRGMMPPRPMQPRPPRALPPARPMPTAFRRGPPQGQPPMGPR